MKTVFSSHNEVAHIWASQTQNTGRAGNIFFEDGVIYSYGRHFPVARFAPEFGNVVLFTHRGYSNSTAKHKSLIRAAIPGGFNVVYCDSPNQSVGYNLRKWEEAIKWRRETFITKKHKVSRGNLAVEIFKQCEDAIEYCRALNITAPDWTAETNDEMTARDYVYELAKAREVKREARRVEYQKKAALDAAERLQLWAAGENVPQYNFNFCDTVLRVKNDQIQTSRGANIPVSDAVRIWPLLARAKSSGKKLEAGLHPIRLGSYQFNSFDGETLIVGCHSIAWGQIEKMAAELHLLEAA